MAKKKPRLIDAYTIGYWSCRHKVTWLECLHDGDLGKHMEADDARDEWLEGYRECEEELKSEQMQALKDELAEATGVNV